MKVQNASSHVLRTRKEQGHFSGALEVRSGKGRPARAARTLASFENTLQMSRLATPPDETKSPAPYCARKASTCKHV